MFFIVSIGCLHATTCMLSGARGAELVVSNRWLCSYMYSKKDLYKRKGKGHRCCLGTELIQFLSTLAVLLFCTTMTWTNCTRMIWSNPILQVVLVKKASDARNWINSLLRPLPCLLYASFFYGCASSLAVLAPHSSIPGAGFQEVEFREILNPKNVLQFLLLFFDPLSKWRPHYS